MNSNRLKLLIDSLGKERVKLNEKLIYHAINKTNCIAEALYIATTQNELISCLNMCNQLKIRYTVIGSGTKFISPRKFLHGLTIKNRTNKIKISGIKGKVGRGSLGIEEALVEVDSGAAVGKLNEFLKKQGLMELYILSSKYATIGGSIFFDPDIRMYTQKIRVWEKEDIFDTLIKDLKQSSHIVLFVTLKIKAI